VVELVASMNDGKIHCRRVVVEPARAGAWIADFQKRTGLTILTQTSHF
jgi:hypothetical protein